jgi:ethanolamine permease
VGAVIGYAVALAVFRLGPDASGRAVLLNLAVFGAVISYALQMLSFRAAARAPARDRAAVSDPLGVPGAVVALAIALATLGALFASDPIYRSVAIAALLWVALGLATSRSGAVIAW